MLDVASKAFFQALSHSRTLKRLASRYGMSGRLAFARRFIAGENVEDAIAAVRLLEPDGILVTCCCSGLITMDMLDELLAFVAAEERRDEPLPRNV
jgi:hypothetical protein